MDLMKLLAFLPYLGIVSGVVTRYGCYSSPGSLCTNVTLECFGSSVISLEKDIQFGTSDGDNCQSEDRCIRNLCCIPQNNDVPILAEFQYRLSVFTSCSNQQSCTVTVPYNQSLKYDYISYPYTCLKDENKIDMSAEVENNVPKQAYLYVNGKNNPPSNLARSWKVQTENQFKSVKALYINLRSESCNKIRISQNETMFNCTEEQLVILNEELDITGNQIDITIHGLTLQTDEFISLEFAVDDDANISLKCDAMDQVVATGAGCGECVTPNPEIHADGSHQGGVKNLTWIIVGVSVVGGLLILIVLVVIAVHMIKKRKKNKTNRDPNRNNQTTHPNPYEDPPDITSFPMTSKLNNTDSQSEKEPKANSDTDDKILSESEKKKREHNQGYTQVNKTFRMYPELPEQSPQHDSEKINNKSTSRDSIVDPTYNHLGEARKPENSGSSTYDHI